MLLPCAEIFRRLLCLSNHGRLTNICNCRFLWPCIKPSDSNTCSEKFHNQIQMILLTPEFSFRVSCQQRKGNFFCHSFFSANHISLIRMIPPSLNIFFLWKCETLQLIHSSSLEEGALAELKIQGYSLPRSLCWENRCVVCWEEPLMGQG